MNFNPFLWTIGTPPTVGQPRIRNYIDFEDYDYIDELGQARIRTGPAPAAPAMRISPTPASMPSASVPTPATAPPSTPNIRTGPNPPPNYSSFHSTPGGGYKRSYFGKKGRRGYYPYYGYGYPYWYGYYGYYPYYYNYRTINPPPPPTPPEELYEIPVPPKEARKYCTNLYEPYCNKYPNDYYCGRYEAFCSTYI